MIVLALETSSDLCSVALAKGGEILCRETVAPRRQSELLFDLIDETLQETGVSRGEIDVIAFGRGPGSFTGLRIAASATQGLAYALDLPVVPVSSLAALAQGIQGSHCATALDARLGEVYYGLYKRGENGCAEVVEQDRVCLPEAVPVPKVGECVGAGPGWLEHGAILKPRFGDSLTKIYASALPSARAVAELALPEVAAQRTHPPDAALPVYLRDQVVQQSTKRP